MKDQQTGAGVRENAPILISFTSSRAPIPVTFNNSAPPVKGNLQPLQRTVGIY